MKSIKNIKKRYAVIITEIFTTRKDGTHRQRTKLFRTLDDALSMYWLAQSDSHHNDTVVDLYDRVIGDYVSDEIEDDIEEHSDDEIALLWNPEWIKDREVA